MTNINQPHLVSHGAAPQSFRLDGGDASLREKANAFLRSMEIRSLSWRTIRAYGFDLVVFLRWLEQAGRSLEELTQAKLLDYIEWRKSLKSSANSINRQLCTCTQFFRFATDRPLPRGIGVSLPKGNVYGRGYDNKVAMHWQRRFGELSLRVKVPKKVIEPLSKEEVILFMGSLRHYRDLSIVLAMVLLGLRSMEVIGLCMSDIDFERGEMRVHGKGNKERLLPVTKELADVIKRYLKYERPSFGPSKHLFVNLQGKRLGESMSSKGIISLFGRRREKPDLKRANPHRFRHTFGADMARAGMSLVVLQKMMGHVDPRMTTGYICLNISDVTAEYNKTMERLGKKYANQARQTSGDDQAVLS